MDVNHPNLATAYYNIAVTYQELGQKQGALDYYKKALKIREEILDDNHPDLAKSYTSMADIYGILGFHKQVKEFTAKTTAISKKKNE